MGHEGEKQKANREQKENLKCWEEKQYNTEGETIGQGNYRTQNRRRTQGPGKELQVLIEGNKRK